MLTEGNANGEPPVSRVLSGVAPPLRSLALFFVLTFAAYPLGAVAAQIFGWDNRAVAWLTRGCVFLLASLVAGTALLRARPFGGTRAFWFAYCCFWTAYLVRLVWDLLLTTHPLLNSPSVYASFAFGSCIVPMFAATVRTTFIEREQMRRWLTGALVLVCAGVIVAEFLALASGQVLTDAESGRFGMATLNPIEAGQLGAILASFAFARMVVARGRFRSFSLIAPLALGLVVMLASASRGPIVAMVVSILAMVTARATQTHTARIFRLLMVAAVVSAAGVASAQYLENTVGFAAVSRVSSLFSGTSDESSAERLRVVRRAISDFEDSPIGGYGLEEYSSRNYPHNIVLDSLMSTGLVGTIPLLVLLLAGYSASVRVMRGDARDAWMGLLFIQLSVEAMLSGNIWASGTVWVALAATVAAVEPRRRVVATMLPSSFPHKVSA